MSNTLPNYVMPIRGVQVAVHPQTGETGIEILDLTSSSVFLPVPPAMLKRLVADLSSALMQFERAQDLAVGSAS